VVVQRAYLGLLPDPVEPSDIFAVFRDDEGRIVPRLPPEALKREPVPDATAPCPACGEVTWDAIEVRTDPDHVYYRQRGVICRTCGLQHGGWRSIGRRRRGRSEPELGTEDAFLRDRDGRLDPVAVVQAAAFRAYAVDRSLVDDRGISQFGRESDAVVAITIWHRVRGERPDETVLVSSSPLRTRDGLEAASCAVGGLANSLWTTDPRMQEAWKLSSEARMLQWEQLRAEAERRAASASVARIDVAVDQVPTPFSIATDQEGSWYAVGEVGSVAITIRANNVAPDRLALHGLADPRGYFSTTGDRGP
jgi:hypothetical protein